MPLGWLQLESTLTPDDCADRLLKRIDSSNLFDWPAGGKNPVFGFVENGNFELRQRGKGTEHQVNALRGQFLSHGRGTLIRYRFAWDEGPRWFGLFSVAATVLLWLGTMALLGVAYFGPYPGPQPYAWATAIVPTLIAPAMLHAYLRGARLAQQQAEFLESFLRQALKIPQAPEGQFDQSRKTQFRLRTLMTWLAIGPPLLAGTWFFCRWIGAYWSMTLIAMIVVMSISTGFSFWQERKFRRELRARIPLDDDQFSFQFYADTDVPADIVRRLRPIYCRFFDIEPAKLRPLDRPPEMDDLDTVDLIRNIEAEFSLVISTGDAERIDGSFDSIARYLVAHQRSPQKAKT